MRDEDPPPDFDWLLPRRARIMETLLALHRLLKDKGAQLVADPTGRACFGHLVGAAFSLWRAAFLTDASRDWGAILGDDRGTRFRGGAGQVLETLLRDNAINYAQDRDTRTWMVGYYLNNAKYRLARAWPKVGKGEYDLPQSDEVSPKDLWDRLHGDTGTLLDALTQRGLQPDSGPKP